MRSDTRMERLDTAVSLLEDDPHDRAHDQPIEQVRGLTAANSLAAETTWS